MKAIKKIATGMLIPVFCFSFCGCYSYWKALFGVLIIASPFISHDLQSVDEGYDCIGASDCLPDVIEGTCESDESINNGMQGEDEEYDKKGTSGCWPVATEETYEPDESIIIEPAPVYSEPDAPCSYNEPACSIDPYPANTDTEMPAAQTDSGGDSNERRDWNRR